MKKQQHITSFYLETLLLIAVFIAIILVLTHVFGLGRTQSSEAKLLTNAVSLAQNAAEAVSAADSPETVVAILDENGNVSLDGDTVQARYDTNMRPDANGSMCVDVTWEPDGKLVSSTITVTYGDDVEPVYTLTTATYTEEAGG